MYKYTSDDQSAPSLYGAEMCAVGVPVTR